ncbi:uncharacterized protein STEHIDRAFT_105946 [Stereum hirsutum FP-91666 SS1]|uniref:DUF3128 domain-containing protein n=1 Tax=Stereum hirsutum (strain FP-91666) TaxID=721885 RepID=R7RX41_STEHR|nr:uncharacterized protein STEHIDRAFT_105946 [Stereum hirsutum FP-91666 SS1]EIM79909.1 hypothetical protein STEHIDRAFT_105946 [Stereum hirsutum FP-91666 SS1]
MSTPSTSTPSSSSSSSVPPEQFKAIVRQEEDRLRKMHPTPEDIPGCMTVFDDFLKCNLLGNQFRSLWRYGQSANCTTKLQDFKFCMSIARLEPDEKREVWIQRRAEWWARRRTGVSSENVWEARGEPIKDYPPPMDAETLEALRVGSIQSATIE